MDPDSGEETSQRLSAAAGGCAVALRTTFQVERSFIIRGAVPSGTNVLREPKVFMELPYRILFHPFEECVGVLREDFFALFMAQHWHSRALVR